MLLHDHETLRLIFLNACQGAQGGRSDPFAGVAQRLVQQGAPAVLAMQFPVSDAAAIALAQAFYQALADGLPADTALSQARKAIAAAAATESGPRRCCSAGQTTTSLFDLLEYCPRRPALTPAWYHSGPKMRASSTAARRRSTRCCAICAINVCCSSSAHPGPASPR